MKKCSGNLETFGKKWKNYNWDGNYKDILRMQKKIKNLIKFEKIRSKTFWRNWKLK